MEYEKQFKFESVILKLEILLLKKKVNAHFHFSKVGSR